MVPATFALVSLALMVCAKPLGSRDMIVHESRDDVPDGFVHNGAAPADTTLNLRIALVQNNIAGLQDALLDVSTPSSAQYGQHLTKEQVEEFVKPSTESVNAVNEFLSSSGVQAITLSPAGDWLGFSVPVSKADSLFDADFSTFTHQATGQQAIRTLSYSIPASLQGHLELVHPTVTFPNPLAGVPKFSSPVKATTNISSSIESGAVPASCGSIVTPACLQALYGIPTTPATQSSNKLGVSGFIEQFSQEADLEDLDIQYTAGVATGVPVTFISVGENFQDGALEGFLDIINFLLAENASPQVLTTSYGQNENTISRALAINVCNAYTQLGARGTSILFTSGDGGVSGSQSGKCTTFLPTVPSACPFVTSVGATTGVTETSANFSSGGFSNFFARPLYQSSAVSGYLTALGSTNSGKFNRSGRAFPDVSAQGEHVEIFVGGESGLVAGTSCASPIFASVISLLNDQLIAAGKRPLGFLNPFLYSTGAWALNDITTGSNPGCNTSGFPAGAGWDPVTGLGTPNFAKLKIAVGL